LKPEQFQRARRLFDEAMTQATGRRAAYLLEACPDDPEVRAEVERLLEQETAVSAGAVHGSVVRALAEALEPGSVVSHYRLEEKLGVGGMGDVYRAHDLALGRPAAVKVLGSRLTGPYRDRLLAEAKLSARLQHPGIATFFEGGETDDGVAFLAMEYVRGETLRARLQRGPTPTPAR
jgi:serine/threonine-protein kinase